MRTEASSENLAGVNTIYCYRLQESRGIPGDAPDGPEHGGVEAALPEVASVAVDGIAIGGVEAAQVHHEERNGIGLVADGDQMEVIRHEGVGGDAHAALLAAGGQQVEEILAIGVAEEEIGRAHV